MLTICGVYTLFGRLRKFTLFATSLLISICGILVNKLIYLPLAFNQGLSVVVFFSAGNIFKNKFIGYTNMLVFICIWIASLFVIDCNVAFCQYNYFYPLFLLGIWGVYSALLVMYNKCVKRFNYLSNLFTWIGKESMVVYCIHSLIMFRIFSRFPFYSDSIKSLMNIALSLAASFVFLKIFERLKLLCNINH